MPDAKPFSCFHCPRAFTDQNALHQHLRSKHGGPRFRTPKLRRASGPDDDMSLAEIAIEASLKRAGGEKLDALEESLLP